MGRRQQTTDMEYKRRTAAACCLFCRSFSCSFKTASVKTVGGPMFNKTRPDDLKTAGRLNLTPLYTSVLLKKSNKWTEPRKQGLFDRHIPEGHVNASDPIIRIIWFFPAIWCLWSCKLSHRTSALSLGITFDSGNSHLSLQITRPAGTEFRCWMWNQFKNINLLIRSFVIRENIISSLRKSALQWNSQLIVHVRVHPQKHCPGGGDLSSPLIINHRMYSS